MFDKRMPLAEGTALFLPGGSYVITALLGKGSNSLVYRAEYADATTEGGIHEVLIKELFPLDSRDGIFRDDQGRIVVREEAAELYQMHRESFLRGNEMHLRLLKDSPNMIGGNLNTYEYNGTLYSLLSQSGGRSLDAVSAPSLRRIAQRMLCLLDALEVFHREELLHMDIAPDNILVIPQGNREHVILIDYNSISTVDEWRKGIAPAISVKEGFSAPEAVNGKLSKIGICTDLYSVTAVFFYCLMGRPLKLSEQLSSCAPDAADSPFLENAPQTVCAMVASILRRGLATLARRRYASIAQMRTDFEELIDRIDCVGITSWAIWEKEQAYLDGLLKRNPALAYMMQPADMYPIRFSDESGELDENQFLAQRIHADGRMVLLEAAGGMGKTTAMMQMARLCNQNYRPDFPVAVYIEASRYQENEADFIHNRIMRHLHYKPETIYYENAKHELDRLLNRTLATPAGARPSVLLLLDGINEIRCDTTLLWAEIRQLSALSGISIVLSSRSAVDMQQPSVHRQTLLPLRREDIEARFAQRGLMMPRDDALIDLVKIPLMLSMLMRTAETSRQQVDFTSADSLIGSMLDSEVHAFPEEDALHWQIDAAVHYVLPAIAHAGAHSGQPLSGAELCDIAGRCYRELHSKGVLRHVFPQWIGHSQQIFENSTSEEEWFGHIVTELLWRRLGLLIRDEEDRYRVSHPLIGEYLEREAVACRGRIAKWRRKRTLCRAIPASAALILLAGAGIGVYRNVILPQLRFASENHVGQTVVLGSYEQDNDLSNGAEPIAWQVLEQYEDGSFLLVSKQCLDALPYHTAVTEMTWENCSLRAWLNDAFYEQAFSEGEREQILLSEVENRNNPEYGAAGGNDTRDHVYLLSISEAQKYFGENWTNIDGCFGSQELVCEVSDYAFARGAALPDIYDVEVAEWETGNELSTRCGTWWLRSPGGEGCLDEGDVTCRAVYVDYYGAINSYAGWRQIDDASICVRPVIRAQLSQKNFAVAGTQAPRETAAPSSTPSADAAQSVGFARELAVGETFFLGTYEQDADRDNGGEPIQWRVLDRLENGDYLVISEYALETMAYNDDEDAEADWLASDIRAWLNGSFYSEAFSDMERACFKTNEVDDFVSLLTIEQAERYYPDDASRMCAITRHAERHDAENNRGNGWWWLRAVDADREESVVYFGAPIVRWDGSIDDSCYCGNNKLVVRPVLILSAAFASAGGGTAS